MIINKELDKIMCDYVTKASDFCKSYEKDVLGKHYSSYSNTVATIYANFEDKLLKLKNETELAINEKISEAVNMGGDVDELVKIGKKFEDDLWNMHKYYRYMYSGRIARGLSEPWIKAGEEAFFELMVNQIASHKEYSYKAGVENDD